MNDPRAIANLLLDEGARLGRPLTNLALQKLLYFAHGLHLLETRKPLVLGHFEAWTYGPVHPEVFHCFKIAADQPITFRARATDILTGQTRPISPPTDPDIVALITRVMRSYGRLSTRQLVDISHAQGGPWDFVVENSATRCALSLRIGDDLILDRFKHHTVSVSVVQADGEPHADTPISAGNRPRPLRTP